MKRSVMSTATELIGRGELVLEIAQNEFGKWALEFTLLVQGLSTNVDICIGSVGRLGLKLNPDAGVDRFTATRSGNDFEFVLPRSQAEYLEATFLRAYRDEMAEVNHVHIEGSLGGEPFDLTIMFDVYQPPMSADEAEREISRLR